MDSVGRKKEKNVDGDRDGKIRVKVDNVNCNRKHMAKLLCVHRLEIEWKNSDIFSIPKSTHTKLN